MITFSFKPNSGSVVEPIAAPASTLMVCWKDEAERNESVLSEALVTPSRIFRELGGLFAFRKQLFVDLAKLKAIHRVAGQELGVARAGHLDLAQHLADDHFEVLIMDVLAL